MGIILLTTARLISCYCVAVSTVWSNTTVSDELRWECNISILKKAQQLLVESQNRTETCSSEQQGLQVLVVPFQERKEKNIRVHLTFGLLSSRIRKRAAVIIKDHTHCRQQRSTSPVRSASENSVHKSYKHKRILFSVAVNIYKQQINKHYSKCS